MQKKALQLKPNRELGTIQNNDINNILHGGYEGDMRPQDYREAVGHLLEGKPSVLAQTVGQADPVIYRTREATTFDKYLEQVSMQVFADVWSKSDNAKAETVRRRAAGQAEYVARLLSEGTSPLEITIEACHSYEIPVLASYRMNGEDWYQHSYLLYDFGRYHPEFRIRDGSKHTGAIDYAIPTVFEQRLRMFTEVATLYDVDGIEFDFRRWTHMISDPLHNYPVFTDLIRQTRQMLAAVSRSKGRERMLLCVRVGPSLDDPQGTEYAGGKLSTDFSSRLLGLDVATWIEEELVDVVCPTLFWPALPGLPRVAEFVERAHEKNVGIYPTVFPRPAWSDQLPGGERTLEDLDQSEIADLMRLHRDEICQAAVQCYEQGADGLSTYNWFGHCQYSPMVRTHGYPSHNYRSSQAYAQTELFAHAFLGSRAEMERCLKAEPVSSSGRYEWQLD